MEMIATPLARLPRRRDGSVVLLLPNVICVCTRDPCMEALGFINSAVQTLPLSANATGNQMPGTIGRL